MVFPTVHIIYNKVHNKALVTSIHNLELFIWYTNINLQYLTRLSGIFYKF